MNGVKNYMNVDHRSCRRNLCSCEKKAWKKKIQACTGIKPLTSAIPVQRSTNYKKVVELVLLNLWKDDDEVMNIWKSYMWTAGRRIIW